MSIKNKVYPIVNIGISCGICMWKRKVPIIRLCP